jgi:CHAT domain-containing protein
LVTPVFSFPDSANTAPDAFLPRALLLSLALVFVAVAAPQAALSAEQPAQCTPAMGEPDLRAAASRLRSEIGRRLASDSEDAGLVEAVNDLSWKYIYLNEFEESDRVFQGWIEILERRATTKSLLYIKLLERAGLMRRISGKTDLAETTYGRCIALSEKVTGRISVQRGICLNYLGVLYQDLARYPEALASLNEAVAAIEGAGGPGHGELGATLNNVGFHYQMTGDFERAAEVYKRALAISEKAHGPCHEYVSMTVGNLGRVHSDMGKFDLALPYDRRGLEIRLNTVGPGAFGTAFSHTNLALTLFGLGRYQEGEDHIRRGLAIREQLFGTDHRHTLYSLWWLFHTLQITGRLAAPEAQEIVERALRTSSAQRYPELKWRFLNGYRLVLQSRGMPGAAAYFGKEAVNTIQALRSQLSSLERELQRSFLWDKTSAYRDLADLLIEGGRLAEAQQVLSMLKEEEFFDFIRRDGKQDPRATRPAFTAAEEPFAKRYSEISGKLAVLGLRRDELDRKKREGLSTAEEAELKRIEDDMQTARAAFVAFLDGLIKDMSRLDAERRAAADRQRRDVEGMAKYQRHLKRLGPGTVMLHYVVLPDKIRVILSTHNNQIGYASSIDEKELNRKIQRFREALQYPRDDPRPAGNELYRVLVAPLAQDLKQLQARTLILSLDGVLRYVPFAALHDGSRYLVQDYQLAIVTEAADIRLTAEAGRANSFAGLGLTQQVQGFEALPAVKEELEGILRTGPIRGDIYLDQAFTAERVRQTLKREVSLLHIASHFVFRPGTEADSYLLLGDGGKLSLRDLRIADYDFQDVELLTLSACDTAAGGGSDANGREVEGLGVLAQQKGARAVMATLWPVADVSTGVLMQNFYRLRTGGSDVTKAEALRQAQLALLTGQHQPPTSAVSGTQAGERGMARADRAPRFKPDPKAPYAHPYFWAPFILMGNWL